MQRHQEAVAFANRRTFEKFGVHGPYEPGSGEHQYWLIAFDNFMAFATGE